jgi:hypothetical protein
MVMACVCTLLIFGFQSLRTRDPISRIAYGTPIASQIRDIRVVLRSFLGAIDPRTSIVGLPNNTLANAIIANSPQVILSFLYFSYNALMTAMLMGYECE